MKILLVAPESYYMPVGLAYISATLKRAGHEVDGTHLPGFLEMDLQSGGYELIGITGMSSQYASVKTVVDIAKAHNIPTVAGGAIVTSEPEFAVESLGLNYGVFGEGEETIVELVDCIENNKDIGHVAGVCYNDGGRIVKNPGRMKLVEMDWLPRPDYDNFDFALRLDATRPTDQYYLDVFDYPREYPLVTTRQCPFSCTFCYQPSVSSYRVRTIDDVMDELRDVIPKYNINIIQIVDELFHAKNSRMLEFCEKFGKLREELGRDVRWMAQARVTGVDDEILDAMKASGCFMVSYGIESYHPDILTSMKKKIKPEMIEEMVPATLQRGISVQGNFIFGDKAETFETAKYTLDFWKRQASKWGVVLYFLLPVPNAPMYLHALKIGAIKDKVEFMTQSYFDPRNMSSMSDSEYFKLRMMVFRARMKHTIRSVFKRHTKDEVVVDCPHCAQENTYKNFQLRPLFVTRMMHCRHCRRRFDGVTPLYNLYTRIIPNLVFNPAAYSAYLFTHAWVRSTFQALRRWKATALSTSGENIYQQSIELRRSGQVRNNT